MKKLLCQLVHDLAAFYHPRAMMFFLSFLHLVAQVLVLVCSTTTSDIRYVRPAGSPLSSCPGQPCLTLHEYVEINNFTNGTTLQFLPGNHTLQQSFILVHFSNFTFESAFNHSVPNIICKDDVTIYSTRVTNLHIVGLSFILSQRGDRSALWFSGCKAVLISKTVFQGSGEVTGRAIGVSVSEATIIGCVFKGLTVTDLQGGGAIYSTGTNLTIQESSFVNNVAHSGGAIFAHKSSLLLNTTHYYGNSAPTKGGVICCFRSQVDMVGNNIFHNNSCQRYGGAMHFSTSKLIIIQGTAHFYFNEARYDGAVYLSATSTSFSGSITMSKNKAVINGGALYINNLTGIINVTFLIFKENSAGKEGGAMYVRKGNVTLGGNVTIENNTAKIGGGITAVESSIYVVGDFDLVRNSATHGGAMNTLYGTVSLQGPTQFIHNTADGDGGAVFAAGTMVEILEEADFSFNSAKNGGAMFIENGASINLSYCDHVPLLTSSFNKAHRYGGVIYNSDNPSISQCSYLFYKITGFEKLPSCSLQFQRNRNCNPAIVSRNDSAERGGNVMFGGLLDRCRIQYYNAGTGEYYLHDYNAISIYPGFRPTTKEILSEPYSLCFCNSSHTSFCTTAKIKHVEVYRGQKFTISLRAKMQYGPTATIVTAVTSSSARLATYQTSQPLPDYCAPLSYTVYSNESHEQVVLYPDGPCRDTGAARVVINVTLLPCPDGFTQFGEIDLHM